jgi:UDP-N-acetylglucosamine 2-epimerase (non-hydrolysing)/GDP/UDP-N,N'-diacetylbacillosamine 2-epimerase (hydrolysing)
MRHCITKLSHLHFTATDTYRRRVIQLGETPHRVIVSGAPALDNLNTIEVLGKGELEDRFGLDLSVPPILVTFHPTTLSLDGTKRDTEALLGALEKTGKPVIFTAPNADASGALIKQMIEARVAQQADWRFVTNFGLEGYFSILSQALAMVGNSSSGIIEAASFNLPVVNIGIRQAGRITSQNVIHVDTDVDSITNGLVRACSRDFRSTLVGMQNPYGSGKAASIIVEGLKMAVNWPNPMIKSFHDLEITS